MNLNNQFFLGSHLCREPMPPISELIHDMNILKKKGFNLIKLQEHWMIDEPLEGQYDFSRYEELIDNAAKLDLQVYLGLTCEQAPGWLYQKYPDCRMVGRDGRSIVYEAQTTLPADGKPGPCFDHPGAMEEMVRFISRLVQILGRYENIAVWNTWQEIGYWSQMLVGQQVCYCENTLNAFRTWLNEKYGDLDGLNRSWNSRYGDWNYVFPDRGAYGQNALPQDIDWHYFMENVQVANVLRARAQTIRASDPLKRPIFAHKGGISLAFSQDWTYARTQDFLGSSCYPAWNPYHSWDDGSPGRGTHPEREPALLNEIAGIALAFDYIRSCNQPGSPIWAAEFQGGPISTFLHKGRVPGPADIRRWMLTSISCGVTSISFWVTRAEIMAQEMNGFSLLDSEGDSTLRLDEAARVGKALQKYSGIFGAPPSIPAQVGILVNEWNAQFCSTCPPAYDHLAYSTRGWHRLLWESSIPVDFISIDQLEYLENHPLPGVLILPFALSISEEYAERLKNYVQNGGCLISEAVPGRINEHGVANRGELSPILGKVFGIRQAFLTMVREPDHPARWMPVERTWGEFSAATELEGIDILAGCRLQANLYIQAFNVEDTGKVDKGNSEAKTCFTMDGNSVGIYRKFGKGTAWLIGTLVGHNATAYRNKDIIDFLKTLMAANGINPLHNGKLIVRHRKVPGKMTLFMTNPTSNPVTETIKIGKGKVIDLLDEPFELMGSEVQITVDPLDIRVIVIEEYS